MPKGILGCNVGSGNRDSAIRSSIVELIAASPKKQHAGIIYMFVDHMIQEDGAAGIHCSSPVHSPPRTLRGCVTHHNRCHTSGISLLSTGVLTETLPPINISIIGRVGFNRLYIKINTEKGVEVFSTSLIEIECIINIKLTIVQDIEICRPKMVHFRTFFTFLVGLSSQQPLAEIM